MSRGLELQIGFVDNVKVTVVMNEKMAAVCFTGLDGRMDFTQGFAGETPIFHAWCRDLYNHYWDGSTKKNW